MSKSMEDIYRDHVLSNANEFELAYLAHHGILGQKWGVRRYQNKDGSRTTAGKLRYYGSDSVNSSSAKASKCPDDMKKDILAVNGGKHGISKSPMRHNNCAFCSVAYEMRRRGEDVRAQEALDGVSQEAIQKAVKNLKATDVKEFASRTSLQSKSIGMSKDEFNEMTDTILKDGDNSRGQMTVKWKANGENGYFSGAHALNYEVKDGVFYLVDGQIGKAFSGKDAYEYLSRACDVKTFRTDNKKMDSKITEKYYTEQNTGNVKGLATRRAADIVNLVGASTVTVGGTAFYLGLGVHPVVTLAGVGTMLLGGTIMIPGSILDTAASKKEREQMLSVEKKWQEEKRMDFYNSSPKGKGK